MLLFDMKRGREREKHVSQRKTYQKFVTLDECLEIIKHTHWNFPETHRKMLLRKYYEYLFRETEA